MGLNLLQITLLRTLYAHAHLDNITPFHYGTKYIGVKMPLDILKAGSGSVILLHPKIGLAPQKHDVRISMPRQQYTNTKHISIESYHPVVSIMLRFMDPKKTFGEFCVAAKRKSIKSCGVTYHTFLSTVTTFRNDCENKQSVGMKHIS